MAVANITETRTYLTFTLDEEDFAVDVLNVREVLDFTNVTRVPRTPDFMKGVINLRGSVVPVVDMRIKFGLPEVEATVDTCIIVMEVNMEGDATVIGALADSVKEVFELDPNSIEPAPRIGTRLETEFISGMGKYNDDFIIILDINQVFSADELELFKGTSTIDAPVIDLGEVEVDASEGESSPEDHQEEEARTTV
jgi:purine-binding chemotaxis protein CheW